MYNLKNYSERSLVHWPSLDVKISGEKMKIYSKCYYYLVKRVNTDVITSKVQIFLSAIRRLTINKNKVN